MKYDREWEKPLIEAPQMLRVVDGQYHLFYSGNWWESENAAVGYGVCTSPLAGCEKKTTTGPWLAKDLDRVGPAGETFFSKAGAAPGQSRTTRGTTPSATPTAASARCGSTRCRSTPTARQCSASSRRVGSA